MKTKLACEINSQGITGWMRENNIPALTVVAEHYSTGTGSRITCYEAPGGARVVATNADPVWGGELPQCEDCADTASSICGCGAIRCDAHEHDTCTHSREDAYEAEVWSALWPGLRRQNFMQG